MSTKFVWRALCARLARIARCERAAIAPMFAIVLVPLLVMGGAGLDFTRAYIAKVRLAGALDAAALAVGSSECSTTDPDQCEAELNVVLNNYFYANYADGGVGVPIAEDLAMSLNADFDVVSVSGAAQVPTTFLLFVGMDMLTVRVDIEVIREITGLEVVLALDNTGSMAGSKIVELRDASHDLIDLIFGNFTDEPHPNLYVGVVPFQGVVNIGSGNTQWVMDPYTTLAYDNRSQPGFSCANAFPVGATLTSSSGATGTIVKDIRDLGSGCQSDGWLILTNVVGTISNNNNLSNSGNTVVGQANGGMVAQSPPSPWLGCIEARANGQLVSVNPGDDVLDTTPDAPPTGGGPWPRFGRPAVSSSSSAQDGCVPAILPLTNYKPDVGSKIDELDAPGGSGTQTNTGAIWGWRVISPPAPFTDRYTQGGASDGPVAAYDDEDFNKAVVLMTDGENNYSTYTAYGLQDENRLGLASPTSSTQARDELDARTLAICDNMKAEGILVFTVVFDLSSASVAAMMQACASAPEYYYDTEAGDGSLSEAFKKIGAQLSNLRLSK